jgi:hypothetical protein
MPWATKPTVLDRPLSEGNAVMRAAVVENTIGALIMGGGENSPPYMDGLRPALCKIAEEQSAMVQP